MADMTATGWDPANAVIVLRKLRPWGPRGERQVVAQLNFTATNFGNGAGVYPSSGMPAPSPSNFGFRNNTYYVQPLSPFMLQGDAGAPTDAVAVLPFGCVVPTGGVSGAATPQNNVAFRVFNIRTATTASGGAGANPVFGTIQALREAPTTVAASDLGVTGLTYTAYVMAVGN